MKQDNKTKKPKKNVPQKKNKLDWQKFNFLENLLIFCTVPNRIAPPESGVSFRITKPEKDSVCILFKTDRREDPLVRNQKQKRPDYLSLFIQNGLLLLTIIEMKGTNKNSTSTGIEQITTFRDILKQEIADHVTSKLKYKLQAILLTPYNADIPRKAIKEEEEKGFIILPIQYKDKAELYPYVSKIHSKADLSKKNYSHDEQHKESDCLLIENLLARQASDKRKQDNYYSCKFTPAKDRQGIYIDYQVSSDRDLITLLTDPQGKKVQLAYCSDDSQSSIDQIQEEIKNLNIYGMVEMVSRLINS
ncbi:MAG: hypothetical protein EWV75_11370 [Microcystis wesenbergii Mw_QC_S_20081001_S30D]|jgi:hypothetical protein|uniref:Uncharacterized protein n=1 Tax=Microcystis wesenbergii Mw_QC_S_20081001_S30D TaxID=2486245 RepID=A0A552JKP5_9CHRO|nr:hypothetical protein [Microcystis aeruginosa W11-03]NCR92829.1 hypothetical protein [Microcystis aeruginosa W11-06]TRU96366.1 MAG: hypothetical protein EWV75_11370 [Microcystis wesenbergii Mw_QC_S_20081001_S30D]TRU96562.1 MAG: hypothetical protein EWV73_18385 [Microcystis wesenbergii Mw_QC_B_20070930_S4D]TRV05350.1 MAG: hypothetical protein EWV74_03275 [Microcystis wesenbergii Mw_QC_S_20081001_S30]TRV10254.1 MAG: hypothetical protein EWV89_17380 [Microcystis wesenbergii Mw_QC_B_20070930_S4]